MPSPLAFKNAVIVAGHPRSGTSLVCQLLDSSGVEFLSDIDEDEYNPEGYYELRSSKELSKQLIAEAMTDENTKRINKIVRNIKKVKGKAGLKIIRIPAVFFYQHLAEQLQFIGIFRNPADVKASLFKRGLSAFSISWMKNNNALIAAYENIDSALIVSYQSLLDEDPRLEKALTQFGFQVDYDAVDSGLQSQRKSKISLKEDEKKLYNRLQDLEKESWEKTLNN